MEAVLGIATILWGIAAAWFLWGKVFTTEANPKLGF